ncbi:hypothetical protein [Endozoicomonas numazuensis]|uniref:Ig-like domain-containing protein n=1 Tax=Endozoicomonas numazuensis TaxID=1137799 RepID=A0A081NGN3_9GAMM|nr:hypothetical protein [Endozoicomonas numazuensis]KEQ17606.1 hypothetical protein GZ78_17920 [Endozoicomonas numazuensis]
MRSVRMALYSAIGAFLVLSMTHAVAKNACWVTTYANSSYNVDALTEVMEGSDDVPLCVTDSPVGSGIEVGHVGYQGEVGNEVLACLYKDSSGSNTYSYEFQWLSTNHIQLQQAKTYKPSLKDPAGITTTIFISKLVFEFCDEQTGEPEISAQGGMSQEASSSNGEKTLGGATVAMQRPNRCMESRVEKVRGEKRRYFSFGTKSSDGKRCELDESRYYEAVGTDSNHTQQSTIQAQAVPAPQTKECQFPEYVKGHTFVCKFDKGTDNGHYWIKDGKEKKHKAEDLGECARYNNKVRFCMDTKRHCIMGRKVKHDNSHNRNFCYICNSDTNAEAASLDWNNIPCMDGK